MHTTSELNVNLAAPIARNVERILAQQYTERPP